MSRIILGLALIAALTLLPGCMYQPSGGLMAGSNGPFTYYSTAEYPKTFVVVDTRTGDNVFEMHIPPGKALVVQFVKDQGDDSVETPDLMRYGIFPITDVSGLLSSSVTVPGTYRPIRTDRPEDRPAGWTSEGGPSRDVGSDPLRMYTP